MVSVPTVVAEDVSAVDRLMDTFIAEKYEGAVLRSFEGTYVYSLSGKRSDTALKYKKRDDLEVNVVGF